jgi:hypothetical protein
MEQLQTRALSHNAPTSSPKHFEQILGLQFAILFFIFFQGINDVTRLGANRVCANQR